MSGNINSLFEFLHGLVEGQDQACMQEQFPPASGYTPAEGDIVRIVDDAGKTAVNVASSSRIDDPASIVLLGDVLGNLPHTWIVHTGMDPTFDWDTITAKVVPCVKGSFIIQTTNFNGADAYSIGGAVVIENGIIRQQAFAGGADRYWKYGEVLEDNSGLAEGANLVIAVSHL